MIIERIIELLEIEKECVLRNATGGCNRYCAKCDLLQDDTELHEMYTEVIALLQAQERIDAIPVEWMRDKMRGYASALKSTEMAALVTVMQMWQKEQEAQK